MKLKMLLTFLPLIVGCNLIESATSTPLPGWHDDVRDLFVEETAFPTDWRAHLYQETGVDPNANHVHRRFSSDSSIDPGPRIVSQDIWRGYTVEDAEEKYAELRSSVFRPRLPPEEMVAAWLPPPEVELRDLVADEFYFACGWEEWASCRFLARYHNYVTFLRLDREASLDDHRSGGLTYQEIATVLNAVDMKFEQVLDSYTP